MLPRSRRDNRVHRDCPPELRRHVDCILVAGLSRKGIMAGETLRDLVSRHCPEVFEIAAAAGFELRLDLAENTHKALCKGRIAYQIRRPATN
jgi:hypothetical protein